MTNEEYLNERVPVTLYKPESEKKDFRTVSVNGKNFQISYGHTVMLPRYAAFVIEEALRNEEIARANTKEHADAFLQGKSYLSAD